jgi:hypothetical protein
VIVPSAAGIVANATPPDSNAPTTMPANTFHFAFDMLCSSGHCAAARRRRS